MIKLDGTIILFIFSLTMYPLERFFVPLLKTRKNVVIYHLVYGIILAAVLFHQDIILGLIMMLIGYFLIDKRPRYATIFCWIYHEAANFYVRFFTKPGWSLGVDALTMVMFQRIISLTYNIDDGRRVKAGDPLYKKRERQASYAVLEKPSFIEWFAYAFSPYGASSGPFMEYKIFDFVVDVEKHHPTSANFHVSHMRYLQAIVCAFCTAVLSKYFNLSFYTSPFYLSIPFIFRPIFSAFASIIQSTRYYCIWSTIDAAIHATGILNSGDRFITEEDFSPMTLLWIFRSESIGEWAQRWNHMAHIFWKNYLFYRLKDLGVSFSICHNMVFLASSTWHGFRPVYYLILPETFLYSTVDRKLNKLFPIKPGNSLANLFRSLCIVTAMMTVTSSWWYSTYDSFMLTHNSYKWCPAIGAVILYVFLTIYELVTKPRRGQQQPPADKKTD